MIPNQEQRMIRDMAREFATRELVPHAAEWERTGEPPLDVYRQMGALGLMGVCVPEEWGGAGADYISYALALEEIAAGCGAVSSVMSVNNSPVAAAILASGSDDQKDRFLKPLAQGKTIATFCLTEPTTGSDASAIKTRARKVGNRDVVNGSKQFITSGSIADFAMIIAVTDEDAGKLGISAFLTPTDVPGCKVFRREIKLGQNASDLCQLAFEDLELTLELLLGEEGDGYRIALANLSLGRIGIGAQATGMARAAFEAARDYADERETFGTKIINHQAVAFRLADMATQIEAARQLTLYAAAIHDSGAPSVSEASMAKLFASEMAERVCSDAIQIHGGYGYIADFPVVRIYRDVRICQIYEGTSDMQRMLISRAFIDG